MTDGRNARVKRTKAAIMAACREAMRAGIFQPTVTDVAKAAEISVRSVFQHYGSINGLRLAAIEDEATFDAVAHNIMGGLNWLGTPPATTWRIVLAAVLGRAPA